MKSAVAHLSCPAGQDAATGTSAHPGGRAYSFVPWRCRFLGLAAIMAGLLVCSCDAPARPSGDWQNPPTAAPPPRLPASAKPATSDRTRPLFLVNQSLDPALRPVMREIGAEQAIILYQGPIDPKQTGTIDMNALASHVRKEVPSDFVGYATLDIEHPYFPWLNKGPKSPEFHQAQNQLLRALRLAKSIRPNAKWSVWGLPRIRYGQYSEEEIEIVKAPAELLAELEWMAPSIYDHHPDGDAPNRPEREKQFIRKVVKVCREIGGDRPLLPYVWHRYSFWQDDPPLSHYSLVPEEEIRQNVGLAVELGVDGIVWWGADDHYLRLLENPPSPGKKEHARYLKLKRAIEAEKPRGMSYQAYLNSLHRRILRLLEGILANHAVRKDGIPGAEPPGSSGCAGLPSMGTTCRRPQPLNGGLGSRVWVCGLNSCLRCLW